MVGNGAQAGRALALRADRHHRHRPDEQDRPAGHELRTYLANLVAHALVAFGGYFLFGGWRLFTARYSTARRGGRPARRDSTAAHWLTLAVIGVRAGRGAVPQRQHRHGGVRRRRGAGRACGVADHEQAIRQDAVDADPHGVRRQRAGGAAREDRRASICSPSCWPRSPRPGTLTGVDRVRDRRHLGLQQHVGRGAAGVPADRARPDRAARRRRRSASPRR